MGTFKPLLPFGLLANGAPRALIEATFDCLRRANIDDILCVTGMRADELRPVLHANAVQCVHNAAYAQTHMFDSIRLGLTALSDRCDAVALLPGDTPVVRPHTIQLLTSRLPDLIARGVDVLIPVFSDQEGHPPLIMRSAFAAICAHDGRDGLRGAFAPLRIEHIAVPDAGICMDADTPADYTRCLEKLHRLHLPTPEECAAIDRICDVPPGRIAHQEAVSDLACACAERLNHSGLSLDIDRIRAAALLHDIAKEQPDHAEAGAAHLRTWGFDSIADIVAAHTDWPLDADVVLDERALVHWADKRVQGVQRCSIAKRFDDKLRGKNVRPKIERRRQTALTIEHMIHTHLGTLSEPDPWT